MKNDTKIKRKVAEIKVLCYEFDCTVNALGNQDAFTDRIVEKIIDKSKELHEIQDKQFINYKVGRKVYTIQDFGGDIQILDYEIGFIGKHSIIPTNYKDLRNPEIEFENCFLELNDAFGAVERRYPHKKVSFNKIYGEAYNVIIQ